MLQVRYGGKTGKRYPLVESDRLVVVRAHDRNAVAESRPFEIAPLSEQARDVLADFTLAATFPEAGVEVLRTREPGRARALRDRARAVLKKEAEIEFAGRVLCDVRSGEPVLYTENFFVKFDGDQSPSVCKKIIRDHGLSIKRELPYARNAYFLAAPDGTGQEVFAIAEKLLKEPSVELCNPELVRKVRDRSVFPAQWHLKKTKVNGAVIDAHANVELAWPRSDGAGTVIAIIDDGVDLDHPELRSAAKIVAPRDVTRGTNDPRPGNGNNHGTACAGVACADGQFGASGVAPKARLMPIRFVSGLGSQSEADAFVWAAQNGADVISCSWGPADGRWWDPADPLHKEIVPLPDSTRLAIDFAIRNGRNGKGCVITWAAGNGNESVDNDGYSSYEKVIAVAACNDGSKRSAYSDFGRAIWCAFPSNHGSPSKTPGIWTTDRSGAVGYNSGQETKGDLAGDYTNSFGGTSSATPGVAGVAALILARNPNLRWDEVKDIIKRSCDKIDTAGGKYDAEGHSDLYGYGRVNAAKAVDLALPPQPDRVLIASAVNDVPILDLKTSKLSVQVAATDVLKDLKVKVDIEHTYIGDLIVSVTPPPSMGIASISLHNRTGGSTDNIKQTFDTLNAPSLAKVVGKPAAGTWTLVVQDKSRLDTGKIRSFTLEMRI